MNSKKNEIYRRNARKKAIKTSTNKKRKLRSVVKCDDNFSDAETIQYAEPYRDTSKKDKIYRRKAKKKAAETLTKKSKEKLTRKATEIRIKNLPKKSKTDIPVEDVLEITGFKAISHLRTRRRLKERTIARANSAMVLANIPYDFENWVDKPILFNLRMTDQMQVED